MNESEQTSHSVTVYIAGDYSIAKQSLRKQCFDEGLCVTITPTCFVYTAGSEDGVAVGFVNYPRFPKPPEEIWERAKKVATILMDDLCQWSVLVVSSERTLWINRRPEEKK